MQHDDGQGNESVAMTSRCIKEEKKKNDRRIASERRNGIFIQLRKNEAGD